MWNVWRTNNPSVIVDLSNADLRGARLKEANLIDADLVGVDLTLANFRRVALTRANLTRANLIDAHLVDIDFSSASLIGANLGGANFVRGDFAGANLKGASMAWTTFTGSDLSMVKDLDTVVHYAPSSIGIDTVYHSAGKISHIFMRGAGVPDSLIEYMSSLTGAGIQFYSCFISYSTKDQEFADRLCADLQSHGVRCWFAPHNMAAGKKLHEQIDEAIRVYDKLLLILSPASMQSEWVKTEIAKARRRETKDGKRLLFPVGLAKFHPDIRNWDCFDADTGKDSAREIREYFIPDFSNWKTDHDAYQKAFNRLLKDLQAKEFTSEI